MQRRSAPESSSHAHGHFTHLKQAGCHSKAAADRNNYGKPCSAEPPRHKTKPNHTRHGAGGAAPGARAPAQQRHPCKARLSNHNSLTQGGRVAAGLGPRQLPSSVPESFTSAPMWAFCVSSLIPPSIRQYRERDDHHQTGGTGAQSGSLLSSMAFLMQPRRQKMPQGSASSFCARL